MISIICWVIQKKIIFPSSSSSPFSLSSPLHTHNCEFQADNDSTQKLIRQHTMRETQRLIFFVYRVIIFFWFWISFWSTNKTWNLKFLSFRLLPLTQQHNTLHTIHTTHIIVWRNEWETIVFGVETFENKILSSLRDLSMNNIELDQQSWI